MITEDRLARRSMNRVSTRLTHWWCHSAIRSHVLRHRAANIITVRLTPRPESTQASPATVEPQHTLTEGRLSPGASQRTPLFGICYARQSWTDSLTLAPDRSAT